MCVWQRTRDSRKGSDLIKTDSKAQLPLSQGLTPSIAKIRGLEGFRNKIQTVGWVAWEPAQKRKKRGRQPLKCEFSCLAALSACVLPH